MYGKLFASMFRGSLYGKWQAIITFQQMIILADQDGTVDFTAESLAATTSIPLDIITEGITQLEQPDPASRSPGEDGRRIVRLDEARPWGWHIVNYAHYRAIRTAEERRAYHREYWRTKRSLNNSTKTQQSQPIAEAEAEAEAKTTTRHNSANNTPPFQAILDLYHSILPELPKCIKLTTQRKGHIRGRWLDELPDLEEWRKYFNIVKSSKFLTGKAKGQNDKPPFRADLAWLVKPENVVKVIEGKYHHA